MPDKTKLPVNTVADKADSVADGRKPVNSDAKAEVVASDATDSDVDTVKEVSSEMVEKSGEITVGPGYAEEGESIYTSNCIACHGAGVAGAPKLGDTLAWAPRIAQGDMVLAQHAIEGYKGDTGYMPAKGGYVNLSDEDILMTVRYMISQSQ